MQKAVFVLCESWHLHHQEIDPALDSVFGGESAGGNDAVTFVTVVRCFLRRRELVFTSGPERFADRVAYDYESQKRSSCCRFGRVSRTITFPRSHSNFVAHATFAGEVYAGRRDHRGGAAGGIQN